MEVAGPVESAMARMLDALCKTLPIAAAVVRDERGRVLAVSTRAHGRPVPTLLIEAEALDPAAPSATRGPLGASLPKDGARIPLVAANHRVGWLEVWGNGDRCDVAARQVLCDVARLAAARLDEERPALASAR
jgi:hypothetical protein